MLAVFVNNGGGDLQGSERGLEYDTMSDRYSRFIDTNVLPAAQKSAGIKADYPNLKFTDDPEGRSTYGCSSGGAAALAQGWFTPDKYRLIGPGARRPRRADAVAVRSNANSDFPLEEISFISGPFPVSALFLGFS